MEEEEVILYKEVDTNNLNILYYPYFIFNRIYSKFKYQNLFENKFEATEIINGVYVGAIESSYDKEELKKLGITHIISVIAGYEPPFPDDFKYLVINALDDENTNLVNIFDDSNEFINDAFQKKGNILIHCLKGRSRSSTVASAYLIEVCGMDVDEILKIMKSKRTIIEPNKYFEKQLRIYYKKKFYDML